MSTFQAFRRAAAINTVLISAAASAAFIGVYELRSGTEIGTGASTAAASSSAAPEAVLAPFTTADVGSCLDWDVDKDGTVSNFEQTSCSGEHRFEVAAREDLAVYPTSEFGENAPMPNLERQAQLREELCQGATLSYLDGKFDAVGKYSIAPILPPAEAWEQGDRTMLCGLQTTDASGTPQRTTGKVVDSDQANITEAGQCRVVDDNQVLRTVPCADPHQLETVSVIDLSQHFSTGFPQPADQNSFLADQCTHAAETYLGGEENLYQSTLQPYWGSVSESSWNGGTHSVNCSLIHVNPATGSFSTLTGAATAGRDAMTIDGAAPTAQPTRNPLRSSNGGGQDAAATSTEPSTPAQ